MKKLLLSLLCLLSVAITGLAQKTPTVSLTFPDDNKTENKVGSYEKSWVAIIKKSDTEYKWNINNFNNNSWNNSWAYIKCGRSSIQSVATIANTTPIPGKLTKIVLELGAFKNVNSLTLKLSQAADSKDVNWSGISPSGINYSISGNNYTFDIPENLQYNNGYAQIIFDCKTGSNNGSVQVNMVHYYCVPEETAAPINFSVEDMVLGLNSPEQPVFSGDSLEGCDIAYACDPAEGLTIENGKVTAATPGTYTVTATATKEVDGKKYEGTATFNVYAGLELQLTAENLSLTVNEQGVEPKITWNEPFTDVTYTLSYDGDGLTITDGKISAGPTVGKYEVTVNASASYAGKPFTASTTFMVDIKNVRIFKKLMDLKDAGKKVDVLIVNEEAKKSLGNQDPNNRKTIDISTCNFAAADEEKWIEDQKGFFVITMAKNPNEVGSYSFKDGNDGWLWNDNVDKEKNNHLKLNPDTEIFAATSIDNNGDALITFKGSQTYTVKYNKSTNPNLFASYTSGQQPVQLYYDPASVIPADPEPLRIEVPELIGVEIDGEAPINVTVSGLNEGETYMLEYTYDETYIMIDENIVYGLDRTPVGEDVEVSVTATVNDRSATATFKVRVYAGPVEYQRVTDLKTQIGKKARVIIAATDPNTANTAEADRQKWVMSSESEGEYKKNIVATDNFAADNSTLQKAWNNDNFGVYEVERKSNGLFTFRELNADGTLGGYLSNSGTANDLLTTTEEALWSVNIAEDGIALVEKDSHFIKAYKNGATTRFSSYTSGQKDITLYVEPGSATLLKPVALSWSTWDEEANDIKLSDQLTIDATLEHSGHDAEGKLVYEIADVALFLNSTNENFYSTSNSANVKVDVALECENPEAFAGWASDELMITDPGKFTLTVSAAENADLSDWDVTWPQPLTVVVNPLKARLKRISNLKTDHIFITYVKPSSETPGEIPGENSSEISHETDGGNNASDANIGENFTRGEYDVVLEEPDTFFDPSYDQFMTATITPDFTPEWGTDPLHFKYPGAYPHIFYADPEEISISGSKLSFKATSAGKYTLTVSVADKYRYWFGDSAENPRDITMPLELTPNLNLFDIDKALLVGDSWSLGIILKDPANPNDYKDYPDLTDEQKQEIKNNPGHDYFRECRFKLDYGGTLYYKISRSQEVEPATPAEMPAARYVKRVAEDESSVEEQIEKLKAEGYVAAVPDKTNPSRSLPVDLRHISALSLVQHVNGVLSEPKELMFNGNVETGMEEIEDLVTDEEAARYFTIDGIEVFAPLAPGLYIRREANGRAGVVMVR